MQPLKQTFNRNYLASWLLLLSMLFSLYSCDKKEPLAPDICKEEIPCLEFSDDQNFVAAYLNDEPWESGYPSFSQEPEIQAVYRTDIKALNIVAFRRNDESNEYLSFGARTNGETGVFISDFGQQSNYRNFRSPCLDIPDGSGIYFLDTLFSSQMEIIEFNMETHTVTGTFNYQVKTKKPEICGDDDNIAIEQGRFRCYFDVYP